MPAYQLLKANIVAAGEVEMHLIGVLAEQVFGSQPDNGIGALLQVAATHIQIEHGRVHILAVLELAVVELYGRAGRQQRQP